jgi:hypothetical protein
MKRNKVVIYTAIAGGIDNLIQHSYRSPYFDYVCFTDRPVGESGMWEIRLIEENYLDEVRKAKFYKVFPQNFFPEYQSSIWIDGNIDVVGPDLEKRVMELMSEDTLIATNIHPHRNCIYEEANACLRMGKDEPEPILRQIDFMRSAGFPEDIGLYEMGLIYRKHLDQKVVQLMNDWWWMIKTFSRRDQLSFMYVLYKSNIGCVQFFQNDVRSHPSFSLKPHGRVFYSMLMVDTGTGFNDKEIFIQRCVVNDTSVIEITFTLNKLMIIKRLKLVPFDTGVGKIKLSSIVLESSGNRFTNLDLNKVTFNGALQKDGFIEFKTFDPIFNIPVNGQVSKVIVTGQFKVESKITSERIISREIEDIHNSYAWKLGNLILWLPRKIYVLFVKIFPSLVKKLNIDSNQL